MAFIEEILHLQENAAGGHLNLLLERQVDAVIEPLTVDEAKDFLKAVDDEEDATLTLLIAATRRKIERLLSKNIFTQTWKQTQSVVPGVVELYRGPALSVTSVKYIQDWTNETQITINPTTYLLSGNQLVNRSAWPFTRGYRSFEVIFQAGMVDITSASDPDVVLTAQAAVDEDIKLAILNLMGHLFENREGDGPDQRFAKLLSVNLPIGDIPRNVMMLLSEYLDWRL